MNIKKIVLLVFLMFFLAVAPALANINPQLNNKEFLKKEGYLTSDNTIPIIIQMKVPYDLKSTISFTTAKSSIDSVLKATGKKYEINRDLYIIGSVSARVDYSLLSVLSKSPNVKYIDLDHKVYELAQVSIPLIDADDAWNYTNASGYRLNGTGVTVGILDSGIACTHEALIGKTLIFKDFFNGLNGTGNCYDSNESGHGTRVAGIIGASGNMQGVAPSVKFNIYKVLNGGAGNKSIVISGLQEAVNDGSDLVSMSIGFDCIECNEPNDSLHVAVENTSGVLVIVAAGNEGDTGNSSISIPGTAANALTVGATYKGALSSYTWPGQYRCTDESINQNNVTCFSSRGPRWDGLNKPDIVAPGVYINTTCANHETCYSGNSNLSSGTSFATPHVTGVAALVLQKHPTWNPQQIKNKIMESAVDLGLPQNVQGSGRVNALYAIDDLNPSVQNFIINNGAQYTTATSVDINWQCNDPTNSQNPSTGIKRISLSNDNSSWTNYTVTSDSGTRSWTLTSGNGAKTVYFMCTDKGGNPSNISSDTITLDETLPVTSYNTNSSPNSESWYASDVQVTLTCTDNGTGCNGTYYCSTTNTTCNPNNLYMNPFTVSTEGINIIMYYSRDVAGNMEVTKTKEIKIDKSRPQTNHNYTTNNNTWVNSTQTIGINASDTYSGVSTKVYCRNVGVPDVCDNGTSFVNDEYTFIDSFYNNWFNYRVTDQAGNFIIRSIFVKIDKLYPTTGDPTFNPERRNWYTSVPVTVTLGTCNDNSQSGCENNNGRYYRIYLEGQTPGQFNSYSSSVSISQNGRNVLEYYSKDNAGNYEPMRDDSINIDTVDPSTEYDQDPDELSPDEWYSVPVNVTLTCFDSTSGCSAIRYQINNSTYETVNVSYSGEPVRIQIPDGNPSTLKYYSIDIAGNEEAETTKTYKIDSQEPAINMTNPEEDGIYVGGTVIPTGQLIGVLKKATVGSFTVEADVSVGGSGIRKVDLIIDGGNPLSMNIIPNGHLKYKAQRNWNPPLGSVGKHNLTVKVYDNVGRYKTDSVIIDLSTGTDTSALTNINIA